MKHLTIAAIVTLLFAVFAGTVLAQPGPGPQPQPAFTGGTLSQPLILTPSTTSSSGFNVAPGVAPTSPNNGDVWVTSMGLFARIGGTIIGPITGAAGSSGQLQINNAGVLAGITLIGDCTFSTPTITCAKVNGVAYPTNPSTNTLPLVTGANTITYSAPSSVLDIVGSTRGAILERGASGWQIIAPGSSGLAWVSNGAAADGSYQPVANAGLATMTANAVKGNPTGSTATPQDVAPLAARSSSLLNIESLTLVGDANYTILPTDRVVNNSVAFTATRTFTLPLISSVNPGQRLVLNINALTATNQLTVTRQGSSDTIFTPIGGTVNSFMVGSAAANSFVLEFVALGSTWLLTTPSYATSVTTNSAALTALARLDVPDQIVTGGANVTSLSLATGSITVDCGARALQFISNNGAWTITAPSSDGSCDILITNGASAQTPTFSGFTAGAGASVALNNTNGNKFILHVERINSVATYFATALQ